MNFYILTLFPEMVMNGLSTSITGRAIESGKLHIEAINIRDYTQDKHNHVDDYPYGGGAGMVMQAQPVYDAYTALVEKLGRKPWKNLQSGYCTGALGEGGHSSSVWSLRGNR